MAAARSAWPRAARRRRRRPPRASPAPSTQAPLASHARGRPEYDRDVQAGAAAASTTCAPSARARRSARQRSTSVPSGAPSLASWPATSLVEPTDARCTITRPERTNAIGMRREGQREVRNRHPAEHVHAGHGLELDFEADVRGRRRVRQRSHGDEIRAGLRQRRDPVERHAARDLHLARGRAPAARLHERPPAADCPPAAYRLPPPAPRRPARGSAPPPRPRDPAACCRAARTAEAIPPASRTWLSLIRNASYRPKRWFVPPPTRTAYFSSARSLGVVFRVSRIVIRPPDASTKRRVSVAMPDSRCRKLSATRSAVSSARAGPRTSPMTVPGSHAAPSSTRARQHGRRIDELEGRGGDRQASDDERDFASSTPWPRAPARHGGLRRDVARADVLGQRAADEIAIDAGHRSGTYGAYGLARRIRRPLCERDRRAEGVGLDQLESTR